MSSLEGAWLITNRKLDQDKPDVTLHTEAAKPYVCVGLGASGNYIRVHSADVAREYVRAFAEAAMLLDAEAARHQPAPLTWDGPPAGDWAPQGQPPGVAAGAGPLAIPASRIEVTETGPAAEQVSLLDETEQAPCPRCGVIDTPRDDEGYCFNLTQCADRAQARDTANAGASRG